MLTFSEFLLAAAGSDSVPLFIFKAAVDFCCIYFIFYLFFVEIKDSKSIRVTAGFALLALFYIFARIFDLTGITWFLGNFFFYAPVSSVFPFSFCLQSFPSSGSFQMSQPFASRGQSIGVSASTSVLLMNIQD